MLSNIDEFNLANNKNGWRYGGIVYPKKKKKNYIAIMMFVTGPKA